MVTESQGIYAWRYAHTITSLPEPPETWLYSEVDLSKQKHQLFWQNKLIRVVRNNGALPHVWVVDELVYDRAKTHTRNANTLPCCTSTGVTNDAGTLRCIECGEEVDVEVYKQVVC